MTSPQRLLATLALMALFVFSATSAHAQWKTQTFNLEPGWNAVFLEVQPEPNDTDRVFAGLPIESVWTWNREFTSVQFIQDASTLVPEQPEWLRYVLGASDGSFLNNLFAIRAGRAYLIKLAGTTPATWSVTGKATIRPLKWMPDSFNFVGFYVHPASPPSFESYLAPSEALADSQVYRLNASGEWAEIASLGDELIRAGEAYWVYCDGSSTYPGPLSLTLEQGGALDFGRVLHQQTLRVRNETVYAKQVTLLPTNSAPPPPGAEHALAGPVALSYWEEAGPQWTGPDDPGLRWLDFTGPLQLSVPPLGSVALRVAVRRPDMLPSSIPDARYQSLLEVADAAGTLLSLPVVARGMTAGGGGTGADGGGRGAAAADQPSDPRAGLWVGTASIDQVSWAAHPCLPGEETCTARETPRPAASEMQIRLIVHVDAAGQARLLQIATMMWCNGTQVPCPSDPSLSCVGEPGRYVLVAGGGMMDAVREKCDELSGAGLRDGTEVGRRISSAIFGFREPVPLSGALGGTLTSDPIPLDFNDPLNPFKHKYHPDHDNLDYDFSTPHPEGRESYTVIRSIELDFTPDDPDGLALPGWGDTRLGGSYQEHITGLHKESLHVAGDFRLHQVSRIPILNDGL